MTASIFEFNLPGLPQIHMRVRLYPVGNVEVSLRNDDRPPGQATLAVATAHLDDCYFSHDRSQPRFDNLWVGNTAFQVPVYEAELLRKQSQVRVLEEIREVDFLK